MKNIVVLVSGGGTNLQALIDAQNRGEIKGGKITCVISSKEGAYALERAKNAGIPAVTLPRKDFPDSKTYSEEILRELNNQKADLVVLAGFMTILDECVTKAYPYKIINVHPALIPSFCGEGFYGLKVHEAALAYSSRNSRGGKRRNARNFTAQDYGKRRVETSAESGFAVLRGQNCHSRRKGLCRCVKSVRILSL